MNEKQAHGWVRAEVNYNPPARQLQYIRDRLHEYNVAQVQAREGISFSICLLDEAGAIVAGTSAWIWAGCCELELVWVHADHRRKGLGRHMLTLCEVEARKHACLLMAVSTYSFQSPGFYECLGYQQVAEIPNWPPGHASIFFQKPLGDDA